MTTAPAPTAADLRAHDVFVPTDNVWQRRARLLPGSVAGAKGYPIGPWSNRDDDDRTLGSRVPLPIARDQGWNFLSATIANQVDLALSRQQAGALIKVDRLFGDLLSSQPMAFNAFGELAADLALASTVWSRVLGVTVEVTDVQFEFSPGRSDPRFTGTRSAFDVFLEYRTEDGDLGFTGVEVKYHEDLKQRPSNRTSPNVRCIQLTTDVFPGADQAVLWQAPVWQLWLDDLLARSMLEVGTYARGEFVVLAPAGNAPCAAAVSAYNEIVAPASVRLLTLEEFVDAASGSVSADWVPQLRQRYLGTA